MHQSPRTTRTKVVPTEQRLVSECCDVLPSHGRLSSEVSISPITLAIPANDNHRFLPSGDCLNCSYFLNSVFSGVPEKQTHDKDLRASNLLRKYFQGTPVREGVKQDRRGEEAR